VIQLSWRQFRTQAAVAAAGLAVVAIAVLITGPRVFHLYDTTVAPCQGRSDCGTAEELFVRHYGFLQAALTQLVEFAPALIGIFWGAPLVARELESGTFRLAWTQSVTRARWLGVKLAVVGVASAVTAGLLSLMVTWWTTPFSRVEANRFDPTLFTQHGIVPLAYAVFAFALGVTMGLLVRRTLPAMAATLALFIGVLLCIVFWVRPHYLPPAHTTMPVRAAGDLGFQPVGSGRAFRFIIGSPNIPNAWVSSTRVVDAAGHPVSNQFLGTACPNLVPPGSVAGRFPAPTGPFQDCIAKISGTYHLVVAYQPAGRYWIFQSIESGLFLALASGLCGFCFWRIRRVA
jgi:hypothetical protein